MTTASLAGGASRAAGPAPVVGTLSCATHSQASARLAGEPQQASTVRDEHCHRKGWVGIMMSGPCPIPCATALRCLDGYYEEPTLGSGQQCRPCPCPGHPGSGLYHGICCHVDSVSRRVLCLCAPGYAGEGCLTRENLRPCSLVHNFIRSTCRYPFTVGYPHTSTRLHVGSGTCGLMSAVPQIPPPPYSRCHTKAETHTAVCSHTPAAGGHVNTHTSHK